MKMTYWISKCCSGEHSEDVWQNSYLFSNFHFRSAVEVYSWTALIRNWFPPQWLSPFLGCHGTNRQSFRYGFLTVVLSVLIVHMKIPRRSCDKDVCHHSGTHLCSTVTHSLIALFGPCPIMSLSCIAIKK